MPRGGPRQGTPGTAYSNRSDLNAQPVRAKSGQGYGERKRAEDAQRAVPLPQTRQPFARPTERPTEPITAGLPMGAGPGPEVLANQPSGDPDLTRLAPYLPMLEFLASRPDSTVSMRNFVRRLRGAMPIQ